ncbi:MAG TPA: anti-sigma factor [Candidatus Dormibacteraeota bacterium]
MADQYDELGMLALSVRPVAPPPELRDRILAASSEPQKFVLVPRRRLPVSLVAAAVVLIAVAAFFLGQSLRGGPAGPSTFALTGHGTLAGASAKVTDLTSDKVAVVEFNGLPAPAAGKVYELWLITPGGQAAPAGVFTPDSNGHVVVVVDRSLEGYSVMAVTIEDGPSGTSAPTQQPEMTGSIA